MANPLPDNRHVLILFASYSFGSVSNRLNAKSLNILFAAQQITIHVLFYVKLLLGW